MIEPILLASRKKSVEFTKINDFVKFSFVEFGPDSPFRPTPLVSGILVQLKHIRGTEEGVMSFLITGFGVCIIDRPGGGGGGGPPLRGGGGGGGGVFVL